MICAACAAVADVQLVGWRLARSDELRRLPATTRQLPLFGPRPVFVVRDTAA